MKIKYLFLLSFAFLSIIGSAQNMPYQVYSPKFCLLAGTYNKDLELSLNSETVNSKIYYTIDGSNPDTNSLLYTQPIKIVGDKKEFYIKAITIDTLKKYSVISSSFYRIDYSYDSNKYITNLTAKDYRKYLTGHWIGHCILPQDWGGPYNIDLKIDSTGHYIDSSLSGFKYPYGQEVYRPAFYYGIPNNSDLKKIRVLKAIDQSIANGKITIVYSENYVDTTSDELRKIKFLNKGNVLKIELWHLGAYGPLLYDLTRIGDLLTLDNSQSNTTSNEDIKSSNNTESLRFQINPNPCTSEFRISGIDMQEVNYLAIYNMQGTCVLKSNFLSSTIDVSNLPQGLYLCYLWDKRNRYYSLKFIKTNQ